MSIRNLDKIFNPQHIALVGASDDPGSTGYVILRNLLDYGYRGVVYPVTRGLRSVQGIQSYPDIASLPNKPDLAVVCVPDRQIIAEVKGCGEAGVPGVLIISSSVHNGESADLEKEIANISLEFKEMRIIGPNALGFIRPGVGLNASLTGTMPKPGHLALLSQSGALANAILDRAVEKGIGLSLFVSVGNTPDVSFGDLIDYLGTDNSTRAIILYVQSIDRSRDFMSAARAFAKTKPIVAYKAGRFRDSVQSAVMHSGTLAAEDAVYEAAFRRAGIVRAMELDDIFDVAELLACQRLPRGARLAIISNAGGAAIVAADALLAHGGVLSEFKEETLAKLQEVPSLPRIQRNPVDLTDEASPRAFADATRIIVEDKQVDGVLVLLTPQVTTHPTKTAKLLASVCNSTSKPIIAAWMGGLKVRKGIRILNKAGVPTHATPEHAVRAFMHLVTYAHNLKMLYETPRDIPINFPLNRRGQHEDLNALVASDQRYLSDFEVKRLLQAYEIPVCEAREAFSVQEAVRVSRQIGTPVAMKIRSTPQIVHKSDVGGVALNLQNSGQVRQAYGFIMKAVSGHRPGAVLNGVTVQKMVNAQSGFEMIMGAKKDPTFGAVIMIGMGGLSTGIFQDRALGLPPINERLAWNMLESLRSWPLLQGYRGRPGVNLDRFIEILMRFSYLVADYPELLEIDVNPLLVTQTDTIAVDAVALLDDQSRDRAFKQYQHLAIRPYPEEHIRHVRLKEGTPVTLCPIRPEDEPLWHELIRNTSPESIRFRFRSMFKHITHEMATRHCYIDYEREISISAEVEVDGARKIIGVGSLSVESDETVAEFAVLVADAWQGKGLGSMLLDYCLEVAEQRQLRRIVAETDPQNHRMLGMFRKRGFVSHIDLENEAVHVHKDLT